MRSRSSAARRHDRSGARPAGVRAQQSKPMIGYLGAASPGASRPPDCRISPESETSGL